MTSLAVLNRRVLLFVHPLNPKPLFSGRNSSCDQAFEVRLAWLRVWGSDARGMAWASHRSGPKQ